MAEICGIDTGGQDISQKDISIACQTLNTLLNSCPSRIIEADHRRPCLHGEIHHFTDLFCEGHSQGATEYSEILRKDKGQAAFDLSIARHHTIPKKFLLLHSEIGAAMGDKTVQLNKRSRVEEEIDSFTGGQFSHLYAVYRFFPDHHREWLLLFSSPVPYGSLQSTS